ncbi:hypothetical protein AgCh_029987 [Apium graveolens]
MMAKICDLLRKRRLFSDIQFTEALLLTLFWNQVPIHNKKDCTAKLLAKNEKCAWQDGSLAEAVENLNHSFSSSSRRCNIQVMDGIQQLGLPLLGVVAAAAVTFYVVSFNELREKSLRDLDESEENENAGFKPYMRSRGRRAKRKADKQIKP